MGQVESHGRAGQQVVQLDVAHLGEHHATFDQLGERGHHTMPHPRLRTMLRDAPHHGPGCRRDGHQHLVDLAGPEEPREVVDRAQHLCARDPGSLLARVVVHESEHRHPVTRAALDLLEEPDARGPGPDDERERVDAPDRGAPVPLPENAHADAESGHDDRADHEVDQEDGAWKSLQSGAEDDGQQEHERPQRVAPHDVDGVSQAHVPPPAGQEPRHPEPEQLAGQEDRKGRQEKRHDVRRQREVESQRQGDHVGPRRDAHPGDGEAHAPVLDDDVAQEHRRRSPPGTRVGDE